MKKIIITIIALVFIFSVTAPAMAGGLKPPKNLCIETDGGPSYALGIKKGNKIVAGDTKIDMYTVQGILALYPTSGTGYMSDENFIFQINSSVGNSDFTTLGVWNVLNETGQVTLNVSYNGGLNSTGYLLYLCGTLP
jgi:hypothetical protein